MTGWQHVQEVTQHAGTKVCGSCYVHNKVCTTPTPDPECNDDPDCDNCWAGRPHVPTRCTCGHDIAAMETDR